MTERAILYLKGMIVVLWIISRQIPLSAVTVFQPQLMVKNVDHVLYQAGNKNLAVVKT